MNCEDDELLSNQMDIPEWPSMKQKFEKIFLQKTQDEWAEIFQDKDACVTPVLDFNDAPHHPHNIDSESFMFNEEESRYEPAPAPLLSRTPAITSVRRQPRLGEHTVEYLRSENFTVAEIEELLEDGTVEQWNPKSAL